MMIFARFTLILIIGFGYFSDLGWAQTGETATAQNRNHYQVIRILPVIAEANPISHQTINSVLKEMEMWANTSFSNCSIWGEVQLLPLEIYRAHDGKLDTRELIMKIVKPNQKDFQDIRQLRIDNQADVVCVITTTQTGVPGAAGAILADYEHAYLGLNTQVFIKKMYSSFIHELGHLMGARHEDDSLQTPFPYGHGYTLGERVSIMGFEFFNRKRVPYFSSPKIYFDGHPFGTETRNNNALVLQETLATIATLFESHHSP